MLLDGLALGSLVCLYHFLLLQLVLFFELLCDIFTDLCLTLLHGLALGRSGLLQLFRNLQFLFSSKSCLLPASLLCLFCLLQLQAHSCNVFFKVLHLSIVALNSGLVILLKLNRFRTILVGLGSRGLGLTVQ